MGKLVTSFHAATTEKEAKAALDHARDLLWGAALKYPKKKKLAQPLPPFVNHVLDLSSKDAIQIIQRFELSVAAKDPLRDLRPKVNAKWVRPESIELVIKCAHGWIKEKLDGLLLKGESGSSERR